MTLSLSVWNKHHCCVNRYARACCINEKKIEINLKPFEMCHWFFAARTIRQTEEKRWREVIGFGTVSLSIANFSTFVLFCFTFDWLVFFHRQPHFKSIVQVQLSRKNHSNLNGMRILHVISLSLSLALVCLFPIKPVIICGHWNS